MMIFSSIPFMVFFVIVAAIVLLLQKFNTKPVFKHIILLLASYVFYGWWDWRFCSLLLGITGITYVAAIKKENKLFNVLGIILPLVILGIFKYFNFFIDSFCMLFGISNTGTLNIILPVGISFFIFQSISYTVDVIRGEQKPVDFLKLALYIAFFPQLVAGPIVRASHFLPQLEEDKKLTLERAEKGVQIFIFGLFKKIVLADHLSVFVDQVFTATAAFNAPTLILAVLSYSFQIYFDFSGYSDMAIGTATFLGYDFRRNFNMPYIAKNLTEFWKRWHISLSSWLQHYLYIPLGGNRNGKPRMYVNLLVTMVLGGLWHGASWNFVIWGILHGAGLCVHKLFSGRVTAKNGGIVMNAFSVMITYFFVCFCWVFFRAENFSVTIGIIRGIFMWQQGISHMYTWSFISAAVLLTATVIAYFKAQNSQSDNGSKSVDGYYLILNLNTVKGLFILFLVIGLILGLAYVGTNPFIYFQF